MLYWIMYNNIFFGEKFQKIRKFKKSHKKHIFRKTRKRRKITKIKRIIAKNTPYSAPKTPEHLKTSGKNRERTEKTPEHSKTPGKKTGREPKKHPVSHTLRVGMWKTSLPIRVLWSAFEFFATFFTRKSTFFSEIRRFWRRLRLFYIRSINSFATAAYSSEPLP